MKPILGFLLGCVVAGAAFGLYASNLKSQLRNSQGQTQLELRQAAQQNENCQQKFSRMTILYEQPTNIFGKPIRNRGPLKVWTIPADVDPVYVGSSEGSFSHYDPKTQIETVKLPVTGR